MLSLFCLVALSGAQVFYIQRYLKVRSNPVGDFFFTFSLHHSDSSYYFVSYDYRKPSGLIESITELRIQIKSEYVSKLLIARFRTFVQSLSVDFQASCTKVKIPLFSGAYTLHFFFSMGWAISCMCVRVCGSEKSFFPFACQSTLLQASLHVASWSLVATPGCCQLAVSVWPPGRLVSARNALSKPVLLLLHSHLAF